MLEWIAGIASLFVLGSLAFWILAGTVAVLSFMCVDKDAPLLGSILVVASVLMVLTGNGLPPIALVTDYWIWLLSVSLMYFPLGAAYMWSRWNRYCDDRIAAIQDVKREFLRANDVEVEGKKGKELRIPDNLLKSWGYDLCRNSSRIYPNRKQYAHDAKTAMRDLTPKFTEHKALAVGWVVNWPLYFVWFAVADSVKWFFRTIRKIANEIFYSLRTAMQNIANRKMEAIADDFREAPSEPPVSSEPSISNDEVEYGARRARNGGSSEYIG